MPQVRILQSAWEDSADIADYHLHEVGPISAERITDKLLDGIDLLAANPYLGPLHQDAKLQARNFRKLICGGYVCVYRIDDGVPTIYRIFHGATDYSRHL